MSDEAPPPFRPLGALLLVLCYFGGLIGVALLGSAFASGETIAVHFNAAARVVAPLVALYVALWRWAPDEPLGRALGLGLPQGREWVRLLLGIIAGAAAVWPGSALLELGLSSVASVDAPEAVAAVQQALKDPAIRALLYVSAAFAVPAAHELLFRGFLQPRLARMVGRSSALAMTAALMILVSVDARRALAAMVGILLVGVVRAFSTGLWPALVASVAHETVAVLVDYGDRAPRTDLLPVAAGAAACALALLGVFAVSSDVRASSGRGSSPRP